MTVQYSIQKMVSDGTLSTVLLGVQYLQRNDIYMRIAGEETPQSGAPSGYTWSFIDNTTLKILPVVPDGVEVVVYRRTDIDAMYNIYSQNAQFDEATVDENNQQLLYIAQEYLEQGIPGTGIESLEYVNTIAGINYYRFKLTDGSYTTVFGVPDGTVVLRGDLSSSDGASLIGQSTYAQIRAYSGYAQRVYCLGASTVFDKAYGEFVVDTADTTTPDNGGTVLVDALSRRWKRKFSGAIRFDWWAQDYTGTTDASAALVKANNADGSNNLIINGVYRVASPLTFTKRLTFLEGSRLKFNTGVSCTMNKRPLAEPDQYIIESDVAAVVATTQWANAYADWFGAKTALGIGVGLSSALNVTGNVILNAGDYQQGLVPVVLPQNRFMRITGAGFRQTKIVVPSGNVSLSYQRTVATPAASLTIEDLEFVETTTARTSIALIWWGYSAGTPGAETAINDDNWLRVKRCVFTGVGKGTHTKFAGQCHFEENMSLYSGVMHFKERGSSFHYHAREMCLSGKFVNGTYIYGDDPANDAYSNGLFVDACNSVTGAGIDIRLKNWQAVFIDKCGFDLGSAGPAALWFQLCQDVQIDSSWIASASAAAVGNRYGVYFDACRNSNVSKCTIVNNKRGISGLNASSIGISDTTFEGNLEYDIADGGVAVGWAVHGTRHRTVVSSGTPIWLGGAGGGSHTVVGTIMKQGTHTIPLGINSQAVANVFGAGLS